MIQGNSAKSFKILTFSSDLAEYLFSVGVYEFRVPVMALFITKFSKNWTWADRFTKL